MTTDMTFDIDQLAGGIQQELATLEQRRFKLLGQLELLASMREQILAAQQPAQQETPHANHSAPDPEPAAQSDQSAPPTAAPAA